MFAPGCWKGELYSPERCNRVPANFERLKDHLTPLAKLGHDKQQRLAKSLGFPNVGRIVAVKPVGGGAFALDIDDVPTAVGGEIAAGRLNSGSVELLPSLPDPADPAQKIDGPILTGVAFLGEEQPAVKGFKPPVATFADGRPVPPSTNPAEWFNAMARVTREMSAEVAGPNTVTVGGREYAATTICFSEMTPLPNTGASMTPEQKAALQAAGFTPDQIAKMESAVAVPAEPAVGAPVLTPPAAPAAMADVPDADGDMMAATCKKFAEDPAATPEQKMMAAIFADNAELKKRVGAFEASAEAMQKKDEEAKMAAFSAQVETECAKIAKKVEPVVLRNVVKPTALNILTAKTFSSESDRVKAFSDYFAGFAALPDDPRLKLAGKDPKLAGKGRQLTPLQQHMTRKGGLLDRESPRATVALRSVATAS